MAVGGSAERGKVPPEQREGLLCVCEDREILQEVKQTELNQLILSFLGEALTLKVLLFPFRGKKVKGKKGIPSDYSKSAQQRSEAVLPHILSNCKCLGSSFLNSSSTTTYHPYLYENQQVRTNKSALKVAPDLHTPAPSSVHVSEREMRCSS